MKENYGKYMGWSARYHLQLRSPKSLLLKWNVVMIKKKNPNKNEKKNQHNFQSKHSKVFTSIAEAMLSRVEIIYENSLKQEWVKVRSFTCYILSHHLI